MQLKYIAGGTILSVGALFGTAAYLSEPDAAPEKSRTPTSPSLTIQNHISSRTASLVSAPTESEKLYESENASA